jgi:hypothetical protein
MSVSKPTDRPPPLHLDERGNDSSCDAKSFESLDLRQLTPLTEIHRHLPRRLDGRKLHRTTIGRWASRGCRGIVLKTWLIGGMRYTDAQSIAEFVSRLSARDNPVRQHCAPSPIAKSGDSVTTSTPTKRLVGRRDRIEEDLKRFGL